MRYDDDYVLEDGESVKVPVKLMDNARDYQPHYGQLTDAQTAMRVRARSEYIKRTCDAWKTAGRVQQDADPSKPDPDAANAVQAQLETWQGRDPVDIARDVERRRRAIHAEFTERLTNAWKSR
jgi:hypothetical protein